MGSPSGIAAVNFLIPLQFDPPSRPCSRAVPRNARNKTLFNCALLPSSELLSTERVSVRPMDLTELLAWARNGQSQT